MRPTLAQGIFPSPLAGEGAGYSVMGLAAGANSRQKNPLSR